MNSAETSILIVDDEEPVRNLLKNCLSDDYKCVTAASADEATELLTKHCFNLVLTDINMPGASGLELCQLISKLCPNTVVMIISAAGEIDFAIQAMRQGAFDYLPKPFGISHLMVAVKRALGYQELLVAKQQHEAFLEETVKRRTHELQVLNQNLQQMLEAMYSNYRQTLRGLAGVLEARDYETRGHSDRVVACSLRLAKQLGLSDDDLIALEQGALLHDIGKIGIPDAILLKPGAHTEAEKMKMRQHIDHGLRIIEGIDFLCGARPVVGQHHEKFDGTGYPRGLQGEEIHIYARVFAVADAFDAITSDRPYRAASTYALAKKELIASSGTHFDPRVIDAFLQVTEAEWEKIRLNAGSDSYVENLIERSHVHSFITSLSNLRQVTTASMAATLR